MTTIINSIVKILEPLLAQLFATFKLKSPIAAAITLIVLGVLNIISNCGDQIGLNIFGTGVLGTIVSIGSLLFASLVQSQTTRILSEKENIEVS